jgi:hypothetical protein
MIKIVECLLPASTRLLVYLFTFHTFLRGYIEQIINLARSSGVMDIYQAQ